MITVLDSGLLGGHANNALDRHHFALHVRGAAADQLRFYRHLPTASIGRYQISDRELRIDHCHDNGIAVVRRLSGGGAVYLDSGQLCWTLLLRLPAAWRSFDLAQLLAVFCGALAAALQRLGIAVRHKYPNDLEIDGRKIATLFAAGAAESLLLHGILLLDADIQTMLEVLRVPTEKLSADGLAAARERLTTVKQCIGAMPEPAEIQAAVIAGLSTLPELCFGRRQIGVAGAPPKASAEARTAAYQLDWRKEPEALEALWKMPGTTLRARAEFDAKGRRLARIEFGGDLHVSPADLFERLQRVLRGLPAARVEQRTIEFFAAGDADLLGFDAKAITCLLRVLLDKLSLRGSGFSAVQLNTLMPYSQQPESMRQILKRAGVMLVPYCAKPLWCKWRSRDGCPECGLCEVGEAYRLAREHGMRVTTITDYEHLTATLTNMKACGIAAYIGMCCSSFFIKRHRAFEQAGMPALLMDISGANCYALKQEEQAYAGRFQAQARLDTQVLRQIIRFVPDRRPT